MQLVRDHQHKLGVAQHQRMVGGYGGGEEHMMEHMMSGRARVIAASSSRTVALGVGNRIGPGSSHNGIEIMQT